jgi:hypothetical protein
VGSNLQDEFDEGFTGLGEPQMKTPLHLVATVKVMKVEIKRSNTNNGRTMKAHFPFSSQCKAVGWNSGTSRSCRNDEGLNQQFHCCY